MTFAVYGHLSRSKQSERRGVAGGGAWKIAAEEDCFHYRVGFLRQAASGHVFLGVVAPLNPAGPPD
jgi:hypothetical protein